MNITKDKITEILHITDEFCKNFKNSIEAPTHPRLQRGCTRKAFATPVYTHFITSPPLIVG